jgi:hypothetical protein
MGRISPFGAQWQVFFTVIVHCGDRREGRASVYLSSGTRRSASRSRLWQIFPTPPEQTNDRFGLACAIFLSSCSADSAITCSSLLNGYFYSVLVDVKGLHVMLQRVGRDAKKLRGTLPAAAGSFQCLRDQGAFQIHCDFFE